MPDDRTSTERFEEALTEYSPPEYVLRLYISDKDLRSTRTVKNIQAICQEHLQGRYKLEIIDIYKRPSLLKSDNILAVPTLLRKSPGPLRRIIGDLSNTEKVLQSLNLPA